VSALISQQFDMDNRPMFAQDGAPDVERLVTAVSGMESTELGFQRSTLSIFSRLSDKFEAVQQHVLQLERRVNATGPHSSAAPAAAALCAAASGAAVAAVSAAAGASTGPPSDKISSLVLSPELMLGSDLSSESCASQPSTGYGPLVKGALGMAAAP